MSSKHLIIEKNDKIASIILNRPQMMNAMSKEMILGLREAVLEIGSDEGIRVLIIKGAGDHFCSGADLNLFTENTASYEWITAMKGVGQIVKTLREMPQPVITMLRGVAVGGGANLALAADFVIAAENARFCEIFVNIGAIMDYAERRALDPDRLKRIIWEVDKILLEHWENTDKAKTAQAELVAEEKRRIAGGKS